MTTGKRGQQELQTEEKRRKLLGYNLAEDVRYRERTTVERVNARWNAESTRKGKNSGSLMLGLMNSLADGSDLPGPATNQRGPKLFQLRLKTGKSLSARSMRPVYIGWA